MSTTAPSPWRLNVARLAFVAAIVGACVAGHRNPGEAARGMRHSFRFTEASAELGLIHAHELPTIDPLVEHILPQIVGTGASVAAVDFDADGWLDLYTTTMREGAPNALFHNRAGEEFEEVAAERGIADLNAAGEFASHGSRWADFDRDGDQDVLVYGWGRQRFFLQEEGRFVDRSEESGLDRWMNAAAGALLDVDRDGLLDVVLGGYYREGIDMWDLQTTRILHEDSEFAHNGGTNFLFLNRGGGRFEEVTERYGIGGDRWTYGFGAADFDGDGWIDLYVANDYGAEELFLNRGGERFEFAQGLGLDYKSKSGMCVSLGDVTNRGMLCVYVTNISESGWLFQGNSLRVNRLATGGKLPNMAEAAHAAQDCGWAWGSDFGDLDLDGDQDLVVVNGFRSAHPERSYWYQMDKLAGASGRILEDAANWPPFEDMSLSGFQRSHVLLNLRSGRRMVDVASAVGVEDTLDGRSVVLADLENDGDLDMLVANQDGPLLAYLNDVSSAARWIGYVLHGTTSNPDAVGAEVVARFGEATQLQVVTAGSGFCAQTDPRVHFGLGDAERPDEVRIRWPSGVEQVLAGEALEPGRYHSIWEPTP